MQKINMQQDTGQIHRARQQDNHQPSARHRGCVRCQWRESTCFGGVIPQMCQYEYEYVLVQEEKLRFNLNL
jgi:hypothetical protein